MDTCIICGASCGGPVCDTHQEDVLFEFTGNSASQLTDGRFYRGTVDGYADFGVFVDLAPGVTGLLHRSKIDRRLESLDWEEGDEVFVQVTNVRDNGDIDLGWSIRQSERDFRGVLVETPEGDELPEESDDDDDDGPTRTNVSNIESSDADSTDRRPSSSGDGADAETDDTESSAGESADDGGAEAATESSADDRSETADEPTEAGSDADDRDYERATVESLTDRVGEDVRLEGEIVSARQTAGPTVFELRDETAVVDCAAFEEAGVRAYPDVESGDVVRLDGEVRVRRDELQVETETLTVLEGDEREAVEERMADALDSEAEPTDYELLADDDAVAALVDDVVDAATAIRRAVLDSRPIVVRHSATTDGYVAGAAIERAVLPLVREEHPGTDAAYHYFDRRPLEDGTYDMDDATKDVTRMLDNRERHDEKLPLFVFAAAGSTGDSLDGLGLLDVYGAESVVVDGLAADDDISERAAVTVTGDGDRTAGTFAANVAAAVNDDVRDDLFHLPAVTYWEDTPEVYVDLASEAGIDAEAATRLREAIALEAYYQSYEDKRELIIDLLFDQEVGLAEQVSTQFREKLDAELDTAEANIETREVGGTEVAVLDTDAYTHRFDFPPKTLLLDELHRRHREETPVVVGYAKDELYVRSPNGLDLDDVAADAAERAPNAGVSARGAHVGKLVFLSGRRDAVVDAVVDAVTERL
ncbi:OB-fold nucleic acid binding domain-containing protein [Halorarius halobius]|uniref:OB-fold nucleic acid binding domain-containing protein n=1 Tax=Halorarius halobius TaxID=2962671 RepID=UPI0020CE120B|nr:OB-fold nucleic acid binding domain-containing protein [Halorarius halobius]